MRAFFEINVFIYGTKGKFEVTRMYPDAQISLIYKNQDILYCK